MRIGYIQFTPEFGAVQQNLDQAETLIRQTEADLLVLPEFFNTGYLFATATEVAMMAENSQSGKTIDRLRHLAAETDTALVAGFPEDADGIYYNSSVLVTPDGTVHLYRKTHLFDREKLFFEPGNTGFNTFKYKNVSIGMMICFDWFFPESARTLALKGAQIIAHPANLVLPHCPAAMITRSLENRVFSITSNRSGSENRAGMSLSYIGHSRIVSPKGNVLISAEKEHQHIGITTIDPTHAESKQINQRNNLFSDRRTDMYF